MRQQTASRPSSSTAPAASSPAPVQRISAYCQWRADCREPATRIVLQHDVVSRVHVQPDIRLRVCEAHGAESLAYTPGYELLPASAASVAVEGAMAA